MVDQAITPATDRDVAVFERMFSGKGRNDGRVILGFGLAFLVLFLIIWFIQTHQPKITIAGRGDSIVAALNDWRTPRSPSDRRNYLKALAIGQACGITPRLPNGDPLTFTAARAVDTDWRLVDLRVYRGDTFNLQWGTHCKEGRGSPRFKFR
jgi:hypothetical protein